MKLIPALPTTDEEVFMRFEEGGIADYAMWQLYRAYRGQGWSLLDAYGKVLSVSIGDTWERNDPLGDPVHLHHLVLPQLRVSYPEEPQPVTTNAYTLLESALISSGTDWIGTQPVITGIEEEKSPEEL